MKAAAVAIEFETPRCTMRLWASSNVNFDPEHIGRFKVQILRSTALDHALASIPDYF